MIGWIAVEVIVMREFSLLQPLMGAVGVAFVLARRVDDPTSAGRLARSCITARRPSLTDAGHSHGTEGGR